MEKKSQILIVDDSKTNIKVLRGSLESDYIVQAAKNGFQALEVAAESLPDLILLDIIMPEMDGYTVCRELKSRADTRHIPIIFITTKSDDEDEAKGLQLGAVDYIAKPFNPAIVKARVQTHLELKTFRDQLEKLVVERTKELSASNEKLGKKTIDLEEANVALRVLLTKREDNQKESKEKMLLSIKDSIRPILKKVKSEQLSTFQNNQLDVIETILNNLIGSYAVGINSKYYKLDPNEIKIANLIKEGKKTSEIASLLNITKSTINWYRNSIRQKLGVKNKKLNLRNYLLNISN